MALEGPRYVRHMSVYDCFHPRGVLHVACPSRGLVMRMFVNVLNLEGCRMLHGPRGALL